MTFRFEFVLDVHVIVGVGYPVELQSWVNEKDSNSLTLEIVKETSCTGVEISGRIGSKICKMILMIIWYHRIPNISTLIFSTTSVEP